MTSLLLKILIKSEAMKYSNLTPAQIELLNLLQHKEATDYFDSLKKVHYLGTYCVETDMVELSASQYVHELLFAIQKIAIEYDVLKS